MNCKEGDALRNDILSLEAFMRSAEKLGSDRIITDFKRSLSAFRDLERQHINTCRDCRVEEVA